MTTPAQLLTDYQTLCNTRAGSELPRMHAAGLQQRQQSFVGHAELWAAVTAYAPVTGWLQFQSHQLAFRDGLPSPAPEWGLLLQAEAVTADKLSLSVHRPPSGGWALIESQHLPQGDLLCDCVHHLAHDPRLDRLRYRRYWRLDPELGTVQAAACFIGFGHHDAKGACE